MKRIGVLAVQGAFAEHISAIEQLGAEAFEIRQKADLTDKSMDGIILPGGESTVIGKLLIELNMFEDLKRMILDGLPVMGTCAGLILLAKNISNDSNVYLGTMDITVKRNAYGRQLGSFHTHGYFEGIGKIPMTFIRAPYIELVAEDKGVEVLATMDGNIVAARQRSMLATSFHPELTGDLSVHQFFFGMK
jgi:5'-phosphate synthase pdxT subunit